MSVESPQVKQQDGPSMAPDRPVLTAAIAMVVLTGLVLSATRPPGPPEGGVIESITQNVAVDTDDDLPAEGSDEGTTVVDSAALPGTEETSVDYEGDSEVAVVYPAIPNADPLTDFLDRTLTAQVHAFDAANPGAVSFEGEWRLTAARDGVVGVRITTTETDSEETRVGHSTYWYETDDGSVHGSSGLLAGQDELATLNALVLDGVPDTVATGSLYPISGLYDSLAFSPEGDLIVEFDDGQVAPTSEGRVDVVIERDEAEELLSDFGVRARDAATKGVEEFTVAAAPEAEKDGTGVTSPGEFSPVDDGIDCADPETRCVALTYDDGPGGRTSELLDTLAEYDAKATFFVTGHPVMENPFTVRRTYAEGHELANHTLSHPDLATLGAGGVRANLDPVQALVYRETGYTMDLMRPPYGSTDDTVAQVTEEMGLAQVLWSVDTNDWKDRKAGVVADRAVDGASEGAIILMHDIHDTTIDASREIVRELDEQGYTMVTVSQLLGTPEPGRSYVDGVPEVPEDEEAEEAAETEGDDDGTGEDAGDEDD